MSTFLIYDHDSRGKFSACKYINQLRVACHPKYFMKFFVRFLEKSLDANTQTRKFTNSCPVENLERPT